MRHLISAAIILAIGLPGAAFARQDSAAMLKRVHGSVLVDAGKGFVPVTKDARLKLGDRVMVTKGGTAVLSYAGDCSIPLQSPSVTTVEPTACSVTTQGTGGGSGLALMGATTVLAPLGATAIHVATSVSP